MALQHALLRNSRLQGWEYGTLRAFEEEIIRQTGAVVVEVPDYGLQSIKNKAGHGMRWEAARNFLPKKPFPVEADVIWYILMGPENYELDLFSGWDRTAKHRIVYMYDTLEPQFSLVKKLFSGNGFNIRITSFNDAAPYLEQLTGKPWHVIEQAVPGSMLNIPPASEKVIAFSSYGRKLSSFHHTLREFCSSNGLYYDYSTTDGRYTTAPAEDLYRQYAWHLSHSAFTISWPVELTNPARAGRLHPITCRWFEAAACGTVIIGQPPRNPLFDELLHPGLVIELDPAAPKETILRDLENIWHNKDACQKKAYAICEALGERLTWKNRVQRMLALL